jgi:hypothetical protein
MPALTAVRAPADQTLTLADGRIARVVAGDWLVTRDRIVLDVVGPAQLAERYQIADDATRLLSGQVCTRLEATLGIGATRTPEDLVAAVERLAKIEIGGIQIEFTPGQLEEIKHRAKKRGWTVAQSLQAVIDRIKEDLFWRG